MKLKQPLPFDRQLAQLMSHDAQYFVQHPTAEYYIREIASIEHWEAQANSRILPTGSKMLVYQIAPGLRIRKPFGATDFDNALAIARQAKAEITALPKTQSKIQPKRSPAKGFSRR